MAYKKKRGRKKKRGPKKKKVIQPHVYVGLKRPYHIITSNNGIQLKDIYTAVSLDAGLNMMKKLQEEYNEGIRFPVKFTCSQDKRSFVECDYRLILIKRKEETDTFEGKFKNEYGKYVDCETGNKEWIYIDSLPYNIEETFWVYGYNPKKQRKDFKFITDEIITSKVNSKYIIKHVVVFKNKVLVSSNDKLDMIICKNHIDSVRLYNAISDFVSEKKLKYVTFGGDIISRSLSYYIWHEKIRSLTNWTSKKINKSNTRD